MPAISVVIPLYNKASTVIEAVSSVLAQDMTDHEVIVIDDGSQDGGGRRILAIQDQRLTVLHQENAGVSAARNRGIRLARAPWVAFLDADDRWRPNHLSGLLAAVTDWQPAVEPALLPAMVFANVEIESGRGQRPLLPPDLPNQIIPDYFHFALSQGGYPNMTSATMVNRAAATACGLFTEGVGMGEDVDLWCRLALAGPVRYIAARSAIYRDVSGSLEASSYRSKPPEFPVFSLLLPDMVARGAVPWPLHTSASRYAHFLVLEHARQLLDQGLGHQARRVLLRHGRPLLDPLRYGKRLFRTFALGRAAFALSGKGST